MADPAWIIPWDRLLAIPGQRLAVIEASGEVRFASTQLVRGVGRRSARAVAFSGLHAAFPAPLVDEFLGEVRRSFRDGRPTLLTGVIDGRRQGLAVYPLSSRSDAQRVLVAMFDSADWTPGAAPSPVFRTAELGYATLGGLDRLSVRELDVLRAMGQGLPRKAIADRLRCPARQAGAIARSLRAKLGHATDFRAAVEALHRGLPEVTDEHWDRIAFLRDAD